MSQDIKRDREVGQPGTEAEFLGNKPSSVHTCHKDCPCSQGEATGEVSDLRERIAEAIDETGLPNRGSHRWPLADVALSVVQPELDRLDKSRYRLQNRVLLLGSENEEFRQRAELYLEERNQACEERDKAIQESLAIRREAASVHATARRR